MRWTNWFISVGDPREVDVYFNSLNVFNVPSTFHSFSNCMVFKKSNNAVPFAYFAK